MHRFKNNLRMTLGNLAQQGSALLILLLVPKLLSIADYGRASVILTFLSLLALADLGLSNVYNRKIPAYLADGDSDAVRVWNSMTLHMRVWGTLICAALVAAFYFLKYQDWQVASLLLPVGFCIGCASFLVTRYTAMSQFQTTTRLNVWQSVARLTTIPFCATLGLAGWCLGTLTSAVCVLTMRDVRRDLRRDWLGGGLRRDIILKSLPESLSLVGVTFLWMQLLYVGRSYAALFFADTDAAIYSLVNSGYQFAASMLIAFFIPQTIKTYGLLKTSRTEAIAQTLKLISIFFPINATLTIFGTWLSPWVLRYIFPTYDVPLGVNDGILLTLIVYPQLLLLGTLLVGIGKSRLYLALTASSLLLAYLAARLLSAELGIIGAAYAQWVGALALAFSLSTAVYCLYRDIVGRWSLLFLSNAACLILPLLFHLYAR